MQRKPKKLIFLFDGTSNEIDLDHPTNVLMLASGISNQSKDGARQLIFYKKGVGTGESDRSGNLDFTDKTRAFFEEKVGMISGEGVYNNILQAYEDLCFNYEAGDEIYVFGFSRGAYTARSFCGFVNHNAIAKRVKIEKVLSADARYRASKEEGFKFESMPQRVDRLLNDGMGVCCSIEEQQALMETTSKSAEHHPVINIKYLGVWDTVKTITAGRDDKLHDFHIDKLVPIIKKARHAVALDEYRKEFDVTLFDNLEEFNKRHYDSMIDKSLSWEEYRKSPKRPYEEMWYPGNHGSVGGGGDLRGLSDEAFLWVLEGARDAGLQIDLNRESKIFTLKPNHFVDLDNTSKDDLLEKLWNWKGRKVDNHVRSGLRGLHEISPSAIRRMAASFLDSTDELDNYTPKALGEWMDEAKEAIKSYGVHDYTMSLMLNPYIKATEVRTIQGNQYYVYQVKSGDDLPKLAGRYLGDRKRAKELIEINRLDITEERRIEIGQLLNLPVNERVKEFFKL